MDQKLPTEVPWTKNSAQVDKLPLMKRKRQHKIVDKRASYGPPDKSEYFLGSDDDDSPNLTKKGKVARHKSSGKK